MRIRSLDEFSNFLDKGISWRKKELTNLRFMIQRARSHEEVTLLRAAICLLYAHWEGFIGSAATAYICFVVSRRLRLHDLAPNFLALGLLSNIQQPEQSRVVTLHYHLTNYLASDLPERFNIDCEKAINTRSNLNSRVLKEILQYVGIDSTEYEKKNAILDERLLRNRNSVAHGECLEIQPDDYMSLHEIIIELIERFRTDVENAAAQGKYRRNFPLPANFGTG